MGDNRGIGGGNFNRGGGNFRGGGQYSGVNQSTTGMVPGVMRGGGNMMGGGMLRGGMPAMPLMAGMGIPPMANAMGGMGMSFARGGGMIPQGPRGGGMMGGGFAGRGMMGGMGSFSEFPTFSFTHQISLSDYVILLCRIEYDAQCRLGWTGWLWQQSDARTFQPRIYARAGRWRAVRARWT